MKKNIIILILSFSFLSPLSSFEIGNLVDALNEGLKEAQQGDQNGNFNSDGSINFNQALENAQNEDVQWSEYTRKSVGAPMYCPNIDSPMLQERMEAKEKYGTYSEWYSRCGEFYPDALRPKPDVDGICKFFPSECDAAKQYVVFEKLKLESERQFQLAVVNIAEAIGLKANAADLRATLSYLDGEGLQGTREYEEGLAIAFVQTISLIDDIEKVIQKGYIPSASEIELIDQAVKLKNEAGLNWAKAVKEREKLKNMSNTMIGFTQQFAQPFDDAVFGQAVIKIDQQIKIYETTISKSTDADMKFEDVNLEKEISNLEF